MNSDTPLAAVGGGEQRASIWEIAIESSLRRKDFRIDPGQFATLPEIGLLELPITRCTRPASPGFYSFIDIRSTVC